MQEPPSPAQYQQLVKENSQLRRAVDELSVLNEIATAINSTLSLKNIVDLMVKKCVKHLGVEQAAITLFDQEKDVDAFKTMVRQVDSRIAILPYRLDAQMQAWMLANQRPLIIHDLAADERFNTPAEQELPVRSLLCAPLLSKSRLIGLLAVFNKKSATEFSAGDQRLLSIIAAQSAQVIENARLRDDEAALLRLREEMRMAAEIQHNLLPKKLPDVPGYDIAGISIPAKEVWGDYFDFIVAYDQHLAICLADVSGKGLPAALLMANIQATIRTQTLLKILPAQTMKHANSLLYQSSSVGKFITMFYGMLHRHRHTLEYCNAGHDAPYFYQPGKDIQRLSAGGIVLGFVEEYNFQQEAIPFPPGAKLILFSDGIPEAMNAAEEEFGEERLLDLIQQNLHLSSNKLIETILWEIRNHVANHPQSDDITLVVVCRDEA